MLLHGLYLVEYQNCGGGNSPGRQHLSATYAMPYLSIGVLNTVIHKHHDEDRDGYPKVPNYPPDLRGQAPCSEAFYPMQFPRYFQAIPFLSSDPPPVCKTTYPAREEPAVLEFAQEEGDEESASH